MGFHGDETIKNMGIEWALSLGGVYLDGMIGWVVTLAIQARLPCGYPTVCYYRNFGSFIDALVRKGSFT